MSEWIEWNGVGRPVADNTVVDIKMRDKQEVKSKLAGMVRWDHMGWLSDVLAFRIVEQEQQANATQIGGNHYKSKGIQPWDYIVANGIPYLEGNVIKYISRWRDKGGIDDLRKARHYLDKLIETETSK